jgi:hypothetical protein
MGATTMRDRLSAMASNLGQDSHGQKVASSAMQSGGVASVAVDMIY